MADGRPDELKTMMPTGIVELEFEEPEQLVTAQSALGGHHPTTLSESTLVVSTSGSVAEIADVFVRLRDSGLEPTRFSTQTTTLDEVFFKILEEEMEHSNAI
jgi:hypothetical protein